MISNGSMIRVPRLTKAWEPNINSGMIYYKLEAAIMRYLYARTDLGAFVQFGEDPNDAPPTETTCVRPENSVGYIVDISDDYVVLDVAADMIDLVWRNIKTCRVGFMYVIDDTQDPMSDIRVLKPILYLNPIARSLDTKEGE